MEFTIPKSTKPERVHENCQVSLYLDLKAALFMQKKITKMLYKITISNLTVLAEQCNLQKIKNSSFLWI